MLLLESQKQAQWAKCFSVQIIVPYIYMAIYGLNIFQVLKDSTDLSWKLLFKVMLVLSTYST